MVSHLDELRQVVVTLTGVAGIALWTVTVLGVATAFVLALLADSPTFTAECDPDELHDAHPAPWRAALLRPGWLVSSGLGLALTVLSVLLRR
ncbi:MAG: hypothetical protein JST54_00115 [Deltaproteobacteria bacterium]|nr:hypothetical protein [Deltaproteobacteria bacterium]